MLDLLKKEANKAYTENGAISYSTTCSDCLDLFYVIGAARNMDEADIISCFIRAYAENSDMAVKILFYARDIRGGLGERNTFRIILKWLADNRTESVKKNIRYIPEFGRYDDLLSLLDTNCEADAIEYIKNCLLEDRENLKEEGRSVSLLGKWLPSINASSAQTRAYASKLSKALGMNAAEYRKLLTALRARINIIENYLRTKDYTFEYSSVPSNSMLKYRDAFYTNDCERFQKYLKEVASGDKHINTSTLYPYDIVGKLVNGCWFCENDVSDTEAMTLDTLWNNLEDYCDNKNALAVIDGSGSMYSMSCVTAPIAVALSLGIYFAERNKGMFRNHFITFSRTPQLVEIKGKDIREKVDYCSSYNEIANTDIYKVFDLILSTALKNKLPQSELPSVLYIISDMEFDMAVANNSITNFEYAKKLYKKNGYKLPNVVFWNVSSRTRAKPVTKDESGAVLVSGYSPKLFSMVMRDELDPYIFLIDAIENERYDMIKA